MQTLKVSSQTSPQKLAGAIRSALQGNGGGVTLQAIGAGAVNQAVKATAIARQYAAPQGADLKLIPCFANTRVNGEEVTSVHLVVVWR